MRNKCDLLIEKKAISFVSKSICLRYKQKCVANLNFGMFEILAASKTATDACKNSTKSQQIQEKKQNKKTREKDWHANNG